MKVILNRIDCFKQHQKHIRVGERSKSRARLKKTGENYNSFLGT